MALAELAIAQRQVAVAAHVRLEDQHVAGAVHRLQRVFALLRLGREHVLAVVLPVPGLLPQALVEQLRAFDLLVAGVAIDGAHVLLDLLPERPALRMPEHDTGRDVVDVEQVELAAEPAMVALLGFLEHAQVLLQLVLGRPRGAVDALEHLVAMVAAPIGAGHLHQLEVLEPARRRHVRPAAEILEGTLAIERDFLAGRNAADDLGLVGLADALEMRDRFIARQDTTPDLLVLLGELGHLRFDRDQILRRERTLVREVVEEAVLDDRADRDLRIGKQLLHRIGEQVCRRMADHVEAGRILLGQDREPGVVIDPEVGVDRARIRALRRLVRQAPPSPGPGRSRRRLRRP